MHFVREGTQVTAREQAAGDAIEPVFLDRAQNALIDLRTGGDVAQRELASGSADSYRLSAIGYQASFEPRAEIRKLEH
jgi:hypothetical protein